MSDTTDTIMRLAETVKRNPARRGVLSTGEFLAVAMVLNKPQWLKDANYSMLEAIDRLGPDWTQAAINVQKAMDL